MEIVPGERWQIGSTRKRRRTQICNFDERDRYEMLVAIEEGSRVLVHYGRTAETFAEVEGTLEGVAYPLDTAVKEPPCQMVIRDDEGCWRTVKSSMVRWVEVLDS